MGHFGDISGGLSRGSASFEREIDSEIGNFGEISGNLPGIFREIRRGKSPDFQCKCINKWGILEEFSGGCRGKLTRLAREMESQMRHFGKKPWRFLVGKSPGLQGERIQKWGILEKNLAISLWGLTRIPWEMDS